MDLPTTSKNKSGLQMYTTDTVRNQAIFVRKAYKTYGSKKNANIVLNDLNMTVERNTIYGLLGASGCGKTTLLSCIVGRRQLNSGEIWVLGGKPGSNASGIPGPKIGYMPQNVSLHGEFSIKETLLYFGWIAGMTTEAISKRLEFLTEFLQLPPETSTVREISGGQQRRVSLCAALIHSPELLILDEPTVGVDPILRHNIWQYLVDITTNGETTIILTTHYIDEMKQAHCIGLMRGGYLLAEDTPQSLMEQLETDSLEDAYLKLSLLQSKTRGHRKSSISEEVLKKHGIYHESIEFDEDQYNEITGEFGDNMPKSNIDRRMSLIHEDRQMALPPKESRPMNCFDYLRVLNLKHLGALIWKHFLWMWRNKQSIAFLILLPLFQISVFNFAIGGDPKDMVVAVTNHEMKNWTLECPFQKGCNATYLSCRYLKHLENRKLLLKYFQTDEEAIYQVQRGKAYASVIFQSNYSQALQNRLHEGTHVKECDLDSSIINIYLDKTSQQMYLILWKDFLFLHQVYLQEYMIDCGYPKTTIEIPIRFNKPIYGESEPNYSDFAAPGALLTMAFFLAMAVTSGGLIIERKAGIYERSAVAGVSVLEILLSHVIADFFVVFAQVTMLVVVTFDIIRLMNEGDIILVYFLTLLTGICGMSFGYFVSSFCDNEQTATLIALGTFFPMIILCGMIWPIEGMYYALQVIAQFLPMTYNTGGMRAILQRAWGISYPLVYKGFLYTFIWTIVFLLMNVLILKLKQN